MHFIPCNASWMTECYKMSKLVKTFQIDCKWGVGIRQWLKCQAVTFSNKGLNHNVSDSLSSSCWKSKWIWGENKKNVSSNFLSSTSITEAFCSLTLYNNELTLISCHWITIVIWNKKRAKLSLYVKKRKISCLHFSELILSCLRVVRIQLIHVQMSSIPQFTVRVYKTHFSLDENDSMQPAKATKLSSTAVCTVKDHIYLLTIS